MVRKKIWLDPSFWVLITVNGYLVFYYYQQPAIFTTLIWLYWSQSMLLGLFTVLDLLTIKNAVAETYTVNKVFNTLKEDKKSIWSSVKFFIIVYGSIHAFYAIFLLSLTPEDQPVQWDFFKYFFFAFLAGQVLNFIQHKISQRKQATYTAPILFSPFIRVLPMHLTIVLSANFPAIAWALS